LKQRLAQLKKRWPTTTMRKLRLLYKITGITKKVTSKQPHNNKKYPAAKKECMVEAMRRELRRANRARKEIFQVDESLFDGQDAMRTAWSRPNSRLSIPQVSQHFQKVAVIAGISSITGKLIYSTKPGYFNREDTIQFLQKLKAESGPREPVVFWDNATIHRAKDVHAYCLKAKLETIFNVPYSPHYNGIELLWRLLKGRFRVELTGKKIRGEMIDALKIVERLIRETEKREVQGCARKGWKEIFERDR
jgi:transposase